MTATNELADRKRYDQFKDKIRKGRSTAIEWIQAVYLVKEESLYKFEYATWNEFCVRELGVSRKKVDHDISTIKKLGIETKMPNVGQIVANLTSVDSARAIAEVPEEKREEVMETLIEAGIEPTPKAIRVAASVAGVEKKPMRGRYDGLVPHVQEDFENRHVLDSLIADVKRIMEKIEFYQGTNITTFLQVEAAVSDLKNVINNIKFAKPFADCMMCQQEGCKRCRNRGWIPRPLFNQLPDDLKAMSVLRGSGEDDE